MRPRWITSAVAAIALLAVPPAAQAGVPARFVGMNVDGPALASPASMRAAFRALGSSRVESVRVVFDWSAAQPYPNWSAVPFKQVSDFAPDPVPTSFAATDEVVALAAQHHLTVLPVVLYTPWWDARPNPKGTLAIPRSVAPYASYLRLLVKRYGPNGSFWREHPRLRKLPIRMWQIWNEPNMYEFWPSGKAGSYVNGYVALLRAAHAAIKQADPGAKVVLAGIPEYTWRELARLYRAGARGLFDVVAVHPYTKLPRGVVTILTLVRRVLDQHGDRHKQILLTELGWPSALHRTLYGADYETTERGQARKLAAVLKMLARNRVRLGLIGFYYYTWETVDRSADPFAYAGLLAVKHGRVVPKPAYGAFRRGVLALESSR